MKYSTLGTIKCGACGIEGIHACLGKPLKQEDLPEGVILVNDLVDFNREIESMAGVNQHLLGVTTGGIENKKIAAYCKECGGFIVYDKTRTLLSCPPKYKGECKDCSEIYYTVCSEVN